MIRKSLVLTGMLALALTARAHAAGVTLSETGSTLLFPLFQSWQANYQAIAPDVTISAAATGSTLGNKAAIEHSAVIGASDAYLSDEVAAQNPEMLDIPVAISAQTINYNLPGLNGQHVKLDGPVLARIYTGQITKWNDPAILAMNPGVKLPAATIVPVRRADGSGDTFIFTQFLDFATETWEDSPGFGTDITWPKVAGEVAATGNAGMVKTLAATPYSVGYVGVSYADDTAKAGLGTAAIRNQNDKFLLPTTQTIADAAAELDPRTPPYERITLVYAPGDNSYPLINYEYVVVSKTQPNSETAQALRDFLNWTIATDGGNAAKYLNPVHFIPLPDFIRALSEAQIRMIHQASTQ
jgi:phosphate transport system substrate-binding protein